MIPILGAMLAMVPASAGHAAGKSSRAAADAQPATVAGKISRLTFSYQGASYPYLVYTPTTYSPGSSMPVLLLIHGAHGEGSYMLNLWQACAQRNAILLVAPTFPLTTEFEDLVPKLLPEFMDTVAQSWSIDPHRRYIFGYSAGGYSTYAAAMRSSRYFAAVGVFATIITPDYEEIVKEATRKTPIAIYIGDRDAWWSTAQTRHTRDLLQKNGFPVHYKELPNQDHNYATASEEVNADAWNFFSQYTSP